MIVGGGASGYFLAANLPKSNHYRVQIIEKASKPLQKVRISGGGRCNLTHAEFNPKDLVRNYPRGEKELQSVFSFFQPGDIFHWFEERNLALKIEEDGRVFPESNSSESVIEVLRNEVKNNQIEEIFEQSIKKIKVDNEQFILYSQDKEYLADILVLSAGSSPHLWSIIGNIGHTIIKAVPSLFTFNISDLLLEDLQGTSFENVELKIPSIQLISSGPMLITHWGLSGPAILKLSAYGARKLAEMNYDFDLQINFLGMTQDDCIEHINSFKLKNSRKQIFTNQKHF